MISRIPEPVRGLVDVPVIQDSEKSEDRCARRLEKGITDFREFLGSVECRAGRASPRLVFAIEARNSEVFPSERTDDLGNERARRARRRTSGSPSEVIANHGLTNIYISREDVESSFFPRLRNEQGSGNSVAGEVGPNTPIGTLRSPLSLPLPLSFSFPLREVYPIGTICGRTIRHAAEPRNRRMSAEIEVSIRKEDRLKAPADVGTLGNHERSVQWPAKGYRDDTGSHNDRLCYRLSIFVLLET